MSSEGSGLERGQTVLKRVVINQMRKANNPQQVANLKRLNADLRSQARH